MVETVAVKGSQGMVLAPIGKGNFLPGKRQDILITTSNKDEDLPLHIRQALVGLTFSTIFSPEQVCGMAPKGSRLAYAIEVADALKAAGKPEEAEGLLAKLKEHDAKAEYHFLVFKSGEYRLIE